MQNTDKHTAAPWKLTEANASIPIKGANGKTVCSIAFRDNDLDDARLIAASPMLLAECERTQSELISALNDPNHITPDMLRRWLKGVEEAIKHARGV